MRADYCQPPAWGRIHDALGSMPRCLLVVAWFTHSAGVGCSVLSHLATTGWLFCPAVAANGVAVKFVALARAACKRMLALYKAAQYSAGVEQHLYSSHAGLVWCLNCLTQQLLCICTARHVGVPPRQSLNVLGCWVVNRVELCNTGKLNLRCVLHSGGMWSTILVVEGTIGTMDIDV